MGFAFSRVGVQTWLNKIRLKLDVQLRNYYTPLTSQVEELEPEKHICNLQVTTTQLTTTQHPESRRSSREVHFILPQHHQDNDSTTWQRNPRSRTAIAHRKKTENPPQTRLAEQKLKQGVL